MWRYLKRVLIGKPLKTLDEGQTHLTKFKALAMLSSDAISSVAYGPANYDCPGNTLSGSALVLGTDCRNCASLAAGNYPFVPANYPGIPERRWCLHCCHPKLGKQWGTGCRRFAAGRLYADRRGFHDLWG